MSAETHKALAKVADEVVARRGEIEAVLLYGSRARGDVHPYSDWDVAVISQCGRDELDKEVQALEELEGVNVLVLRPDWIELDCNLAGTISASIARQGKVVAGTWKRPQTRHEGLEIVDHRLNVDSARVAIQAIAAAARELHPEDESDQRHHFTGTIMNTQVAAEQLGKIMMVCYGLALREKHDVRQIAASLRDAYRQGSQKFDKTTRRAFADQLDELNGGTAKAHIANYIMLEASVASMRGDDKRAQELIKENLEPKRDTEERLIGSVKLFSDWLTWYPVQYPEAHGAAVSIASKVIRESEKIERDEEFLAARDDIREAIREWGTRAKEVKERIEKGHAAIGRSSTKSDARRWADMADKGDRDRNEIARGGHERE